MKTLKYLVLATLLLVLGIAHAQTSFSCSSYKICSIGDDGEIENVSDDVDSPTLFVVNEEETEITLTNFEYTLKYKVKSSETTELGVMFRVKDEDGGDSVISFDVDNKLVGYTFTHEGNQYVMLYKVKAIF